MCAKISENKEYKVGIGCNKDQIFVIQAYKLMSKPVKILIKKKPHFLSGSVENPWNSHRLIWTILKQFYFHIIT